LLLNLQICITTSTSAGLEQILPWMFYHKVIGVSSFFLFVEGKAASPDVVKVLESIPVSQYVSTALTAWVSFKSMCFSCIFLKWSCSTLIYIMFVYGTSFKHDFCGFLREWKWYIEQESWRSNRLRGLLTFTFVLASCMFDLKFL
jgi:hypothetical protein